MVTLRTQRVDADRGCWEAQRKGATCPSQRVHMASADPPHVGCDIELLVLASASSQPASLQSPLSRPWSLHLRDGRCVHISRACAGGFVTIHTGLLDPASLAARFEARLPNNGARRLVRKKRGYWLGRTPVTGGRGQRVRSRMRTNRDGSLGMASVAPTLCFASDKLLSRLSMPLMDAENILIMHMHMHSAWQGR